jgi:hypothetical protein
MHEPSGKVLTRAYYNHPAVTYIIPDPSTRQAVLSWFFTAVAVPTNVDGCSWISPGVDLAIGHAVRAQRLSLPFNLDRGIIRRWINVSRHLESVRRRLTDGDVQSCYVEIFNETDLPFYVECGFQITGAGRIPEGGPNFWTLIRPPRRVYAPRAANDVMIAARHLSHLRHPMAEAR